MLIFLVNNCENSILCSVNENEYKHLAPYERISFETDAPNFTVRLKSPEGSRKELSSNFTKKGFLGSLYRMFYKKDKIMQYDWMVAPESIFTVQGCKDFDEIELVRCSRLTEDGIMLDYCKAILPQYATLSYFASQLSDCDEMEREYGEISKSTAKKFFILEIIGVLAFDTTGSLLLFIIMGLLLGFAKAFLYVGSIFLACAVIIGLFALPEYLQNRKRNPISNCRRPEYINGYLIS